VVVGTNRRASGLFDMMRRLLFCVSLVRLLCDDEEDEANTNNIYKHIFRVNLIY